MKIVIQSELVYSLIITVVLAIFFIWVGKKFKEGDPLKKPHGILLVFEMLVSWLYDYYSSIMPKKFQKNYFPYFTMLFIWILVSNLSGLIGFDAPTSNYSITLSLTIITWVLIQYNSIKHNGIGSYLKANLIPPTNLFSLISPLISISMRIFCNMLSGVFIMSLVYSFTTWLSEVITMHVIKFNFIGPLVAPWLHAYFDVFSGVIQAIVFVTLSTIMISMENPDEE